MFAPIQHVVMRSATPQLSKKVLSFTDENMSLENARISLNPILIIAACFQLQSNVKQKVSRYAVFICIITLARINWLIPWCCFPCPIHPPDLGSFSFFLSVLLQGKENKQGLKLKNYKTCCNGYNVFQCPTKFYSLNILYLTTFSKKKKNHINKMPMVWNINWNLCHFSNFL